MEIVIDFSDSEKSCRWTWMGNEIEFTMADSPAGVKCGLSTVAAIQKSWHLK